MTQLVRQNNQFLPTFLIVSIDFPHFLQEHIFFPLKIGAICMTENSSTFSATKYHFYNEFAENDQIFYYQIFPPDFYADKSPPHGMQKKTQWPLWTCVY